MKKNLKLKNIILLQIFIVIFLKNLKLKTLKKLKKVPGLNKLENIAKKYIGSTDYKNASEKMRNILVKHVNLDLTEELEKIKENLEKFKVAPKNSTLLCIEGGSAGKKIGFLKEDVCFVGTDEEFNKLVDDEFEDAKTRRDYYVIDIVFVVVFVFVESFFLPLLVLFFLVS